MKTFITMMATAMIALPVVTHASRPILVNHTKSDISYAVGGVCMQSSLERDDFIIVSQSALDLGCGTNTSDCLIAVYQSRRCSHNMIAGITVDVNKGVKEAVYLANRYSATINPNNNAIIINEALGSNK